MRFPRSSGILLPVFSLSGGHSVGDLGPAAYQFVDWLQSAGQTIWQLLPLGPTAKGDSPYSSYSAFAGNPLLISLQQLVEQGLLKPSDIPATQEDSHNSYAVNYDQARRIKTPLLQKAFTVFRTMTAGSLRERYVNYCAANTDWLNDFARYEALAIDLNEADWSKWPAELVRPLPHTLSDVDLRLAEQMDYSRFQQFVFADQWQRLKSYANARNIRIYGDMPIFVAYESVDVWTNQRLFELDENGRPVVVAGVPPDYFSATGQMWGNPLYRWNELAETNYGWWTRRFQQAFEYFDILRIDHFRGFESYWEIPSGAETAVEGQWRNGPAEAPFLAARDSMGERPIVAEDLGLITDDVHHLRDRLGLPGMRVLQFGFETQEDNYHRPEAWPEHCVAYTGTHDNDTSVGWYRHRCAQGTADLIEPLLSGDSSQVHLDLVTAVLQSRADTAVIPLQDVLGLGSEARTNTPGLPNGNWTWRCAANDLTETLAATLQEIVHNTSRL